DHDSGKPPSVPSDLRSDRLQAVRARSCSALGCIASNRNTGWVETLRGLTSSPGRNRWGCCEVAPIAADAASACWPQPRRATAAMPPEELPQSQARPAWYSREGPEAPTNAATQEKAVRRSSSSLSQDCNRQTRGARREP